MVVHRETIIALMLLVESWLGIRWIAPGHHRRLEEKQFRAQHGDVRKLERLHKPMIDND